MPARYASLYDLKIVKTPADGFEWDYTVPDETDGHHKQSYGFSREKSYNNQPRATIRATLHQYKTYEEKLVFDNINLLLTRPSNAVIGQPIDRGNRSFTLNRPLTLTTPSGISVTLGTRNQNSNSVLDLNGNANALPIGFQISPAQKRVSLPHSPLYKKFGRPVSIQLESSDPNSMIASWVDNVSNTLSLEYAGAKQAIELDTLTIIVRQRVELQTIPIALEVPVERPAKTK